MRAGSKALPVISQMFARPSSADMNYLQCQSLDSEEGNETITTCFRSSSIGNIVGRESSLQRFVAETESRMSNKGSISDALSGYSTSESQVTYTLHWNSCLVAFEEYFSCKR